MMMRAIAVAAVVSGLGAALGVYAGSPERRESLAAWFGAPAPVATIAPEDWVICTTMGQGQLGSEADWAQLDPDFAAGKRALSAEQWDAAIAALRFASLRDPRNADIQNYIGYAYRRLRQYGPAMQHYQQALVLNRRHRSAHEHLGELYLALGEPAQAEQHLASLEDICLIPCVEYDDLKRAIAAYKQTVATR
jgi:tetratricopeptide (TPR) repeat protein